MKISRVSANNHMRVFEIDCPRGHLTFPYARCAPMPRAEDPIERLYIDTELASEAFTYELKSGAQGSVHADQVLDYNEDPDYVRGALIYRLTLEAQQRVQSSGLAKREIIRRLGTSAAQLYRLLDQTNTRKTLDSMVELLRVLDCEVDVTVRERSA